MKYNDINVPSLIDTTTGNYIYNTLHNCHETRVKSYSFILNIIVLLLFFCLGGFILYLCFTRKLNTHEQQEKLLRDQQMILEKIRAFKEIQQNYHSETFTHLPFTGQQLSNEGV